MIGHTRNDTSPSSKSTARLVGERENNEKMKEESETIKRFGEVDGRCARLWIGVCVCVCV